ncbi:ABC transporter ATP-binding protein [Erysipelothrix sp. HDW6B]|uniref:ABC transporter ATP-binding protein n=1 Tax=Erysipelothrix TaxID=1647 RepID=UPI00135A2D20|nr:MULTISPECIES: ABC transporter ATP-binding protein [Erysipelothrix]QIK85361.1 ABC transporter ATP-binding protein [Erysipelothrix sp. HDW6B]
MAKNNSSAPSGKAKDMKQTIRKLAGLIKPHMVKFIFVLIAALISTVLAIIGPKILGQATTVLFEGLVSRVQGLGGVDFEKIGQILIFLSAIYGFSFLFSYIQGFVMARISRDITFKLRKDMQVKIDRLPLSYFDKTTVGDTLSIVTNDIDVIDTNLTNSITQILTSVTTIVGVLYMMITINWQMTLAALLVMPVSFGIMVFIFSRSQKFFQAQQDNLGELNSHIEEMYGSQIVVKAYNAEDISLAKHDEINNRLYDSTWKSNFFSGLAQPMMNFIGNAGYVVISILGGWYATQGMISVGDIQSFIQYMRNFLNPIAQLGSISAQFQQSIAAAERVFEFLEEDEEPAETPVDYDLETLQSSVMFENVNFGYLPGQTIINDFSTYVKPGQKVAIVGPTGAGKTTIVKLLMRFYDVTSGSIMIDGIDIRNFKREDLRSTIGMVLQDTWLYSGSIKENIRYGNLAATDEEVYTAAQEAQVDHFVRTLADGYDTVLNEETSNVSQGQKQLLTIARAILADPKIMILDEATSSVDTRTEVLIQQALDKLMEGRTSFIIAHRLSTIRNADMILVMDKGDIIEVGNHEELIAKDGFYATLYNSQFSED